MQDQALAEATKPGYKTSELYVTVIAMILTFLSMKGIIAASDVNPLLNGFVLLYAGGVGVIGIVGIAHKYIGSRTNVKTQTLQTTPLQTQ